MHLSDDQIQDFLDGNLGKADSAVLHLDECAACRNAIEEYRTLYRGLAEEPELNLSPDFADKVLAGLPPMEIPVRRPFGQIRVPEWVIWVTSLMIAVGISVYFLKPLTLLKSLLGWVGEPSTLGSGLSQSLSNFSNSLGFDPTLIIYAVLTLVVIAVVDRMVAHHRSGSHEISTFA